jgi:hypothetical protein
MKLLTADESKNIIEQVIKYITNVQKGGIQMCAAHQHQDASNEELEKIVQKELKETINNLKLNGSISVHQFKDYSILTIVEFSKFVEKDSFYSNYLSAYAIKNSMITDVTGFIKEWDVFPQTFEGFIETTD